MKKLAPRSLTALRACPRHLFPSVDFIDLSRALFAAGGRGATVQPLREMAETAPWPEVSVLAMHGVSPLPTETLRLLSSAFPRVQGLSLDGCTLTGDEGGGDTSAAAALGGPLLPRMHTLLLTSLRGLSFPSLAAMLSACTSLKELNLSHTLAFVPESADAELASHLADGKTAVREGDGGDVAVFADALRRLAATSRLRHVILESARSATSPATIEAIGSALLLPAPALLRNLAVDEGAVEAMRAMAALKERAGDGGDKKARKRVAVQAAPNPDSIKEIVASCRRAIARPPPASPLDSKYCDRLSRVVFRCGWCTAAQHVFPLVARAMADAEASVGLSLYASFALLGATRGFACSLTRSGDAAFGGAAVHEANGGPPGGLLALRLARGGSAAPRGRRGDEKKWRADGGVELARSRFLAAIHDGGRATRRLHAPPIAAALRSLADEVARSDHTTLRGYFMSVAAPESIRAAAFASYFSVRHVLTAAFCPTKKFYCFAFDC